MNLGEKIKQERKRLMIKQSDLARSSGITPGALSLIEGSKRTPSRMVLKRIARALSQSLGSFFLDEGTETVEKHGPSNVEILFNNLNIITEHDKQLIGKHIKELLEPEDYARKLRGDLGNIDEPIDPITAAQELGIKVSEDNFKGFAGALIKTERKYLILLAADLYRLKKNFVVSHELGHWYIPTHTNEKYICRLEDIEKYSEQNIIERRANKFAAEFLMPAIAFRRAIKGKALSLKTITNLAEYFRVSLQAAAIKFSEITRYSCAVILIDDGVIKWFSKSSSFPYFLEINRPPSKETLASKFFIKKPSSNTLKGKVPLSAWVRHDNERKRFVEESMYFSRYDSVLTLLIEKDG